MGDAMESWEVQMIDWLRLSMSNPKEAISL